MPRNSAFFGTPVGLFFVMDRVMTVRRERAIPSARIILSVMAIGHADPAAPENTLRTDRVAPEAFMIFYRQHVPTRDPRPSRSVP